MSIAKNVRDIATFSNKPLTQSSETIDPTSVVSSGPITERTDVLHTDASGKQTAGVWESDPGIWTIDTQEDEFIHLMEGGIRLVDEEGAEVTYGPGDSFLVPFGFKGTWESIGHVRKIFVALVR